jgi:hypothetical protein
VGYASHLLIGDTPKTTHASWKSSCRILHSPGPLGGLRANPEYPAVPDRGVVYGMYGWVPNLFSTHPQLPTLYCVCTRAPIIPRDRHRLFGGSGPLEPALWPEVFIAPSLSCETMGGREPELLSRGTPVQLGRNPT